MDIKYHKWCKLTLNPKTIKDTALVTQGVKELQTGRQTTQPIRARKKTYWSHDSWGTCSTARRQFPIANKTRQQNG